MLTVEVLVTAVFMMVLIGASIASADTARNEQRLRRLERSDPAAADAVRRAQAVADYARGGFFGLDAVALTCTPSRRSLHVGGDLEELEPEPEPRPRSGVATSARLVRALHDERPAPAAAEHLPATNRRDAASARLSRRAARTARATRRRPAGIR